MTEFTKFVRSAPICGSDLRKCFADEDLIFHCQDGTIKSNQLLLSISSGFLKQIFLGFQVLEYCVTESGYLAPTQRRKSNEILEIWLPDFTIKDVHQVISLANGIEIRKDNLDNVNSLLRTLGFKNTIHLVSEKNSRPGTEPVCETSSRSKPVCETIIKQEVLDELDNKRNINIETAADDASDQRQKGVENACDGQNQDENAFDGQKEYENDLSFNESEISNNTQNEAVKKANQKLIDQMLREEKRKRPSVKNIPARKKRRNVKHLVKIYSNEEDLNVNGWENITCIICGIEVIANEDKQRKNRKWYMDHLLVHFMCSLFKDISEKTKKHKCSYDSCSFSGNYKKYVEHLAYDHKQFYIRIDNKIKELSNTTESNSDEIVSLEEWKLIKELLMTDLRVIETCSTSSNVPEVWIQDEQFLEPTESAKDKTENLYITTEVTNLNDLPEEQEIICRSSSKLSPEKSKPSNAISPVSDTSIDEFDSASQIGINILEAVEDAPETILAVEQHPFKKKRSLDQSKPREFVTQISALNSIAVPELPMDIDADTSKEIDHMKNAEERSLKSTSSSEYSYTSGTCAPGIIPAASEKMISSAASSLVTCAPAPTAVKAAATATEQDIEDLLKDAEDEVEEPVEQPVLNNLPASSDRLSTVQPSREEISSVTRGSTPTASIIVDDIYAKNSVFRCLECRKDYPAKTDLIMHILKNHIRYQKTDIKEISSNEWKCGICDIILSSRVGLIGHLLKTHDTYEEARAYMSGLIGTATSSTLGRSSVVGDSSSGIGPARSIISKDVKQEIINSGLTMSPASDSDNILHNFSCTKCSAEFNTEESIRQHVVIEHLIEEFKEIAPTGKKIYECVHCHSYARPGRKEYIYHLSSSHSVVELSKIYECIKESSVPFLEIDVIRCRCGVSCTSEAKRKSHIISTHFKDKFSKILKNQNVYNCNECGQRFERRSPLIEHLVFKHNYISKADLNHYVPGSGEQAHISMPGENGTEIDFNDSVSQLHLQRVDHHKRKMALNIVLKCPVCGKVQLNQANFEDHLGTHGIKQEPVYHCTECNFAASFANQFYHLKQVHKENSQQVSLRCLCCDEDETEASLISHSRSDSHCKAAQQFNKDKRLYFTFRYSCQMCSFYFKSLESLGQHLKESVNHNNELNKTSEPVFHCHLCDQSKSASAFEFAQHVNNQRHVYEVNQESTKYPKLYGISDACINYSCETCKCATNYTKLREHLKDTCEEIKCGPCDELLRGHKPVLMEAFRKHVHSDKHKNCVDVFSSLPANKFNAKYVYECTSCLIVFPSLTKFKSLSNLHLDICTTKRQFRCLPCNKIVDMNHGIEHYSSHGHKQNMIRISPLDNDTVIGTQVVDLEQSPCESPELELEIIEENVASSSSTSSPKRRRRECETVVLEEPESRNIQAIEDESIILLPAQENRLRRPQPAPSVFEVAEDEDIQEVEHQQDVQEVEHQEDVQEVEHQEDVQVVQHQIDARQQRDIQEFQHQEYILEVQHQEIQEIEEDIQEVEQFKKPTGALPIRRAVQRQPQEPGTYHQQQHGTLPQRPQQKAGQQLQGGRLGQRHVRGNKRQSGGAGRVVSGTGQEPPNPTTPLIVSPEQRIIKRKRKIYLCATEGCTVLLMQKEMADHAKSHLRRSHTVDIKCTVCNLHIKGPGILSKLNGHSLLARHKSNLIQPQ